MLRFVTTKYEKGIAFEFYSLEKKTKTKEQIFLYAFVFVSISINFASTKQNTKLTTSEIHIFRIGSAQFQNPGVTLTSMKKSNTNLSKNSNCKPTDLHEPIPDWQQNTVTKNRNPNRSRSQINLNIQI